MSKSSSSRRRDRHDKRDDENLMMDQDLINVKETRGGPSTPPLMGPLDSKFKKQSDLSRERDLSESPSRRMKDDSKHSKDRKKKKEKRKLYDAESDDNSMNDQEMMET